MLPVARKRTNGFGSCAKREVSRGRWSVSTMTRTRRAVTSSLAIGLVLSTALIGSSAHALAAPPGTAAAIASTSGYLSAANGDVSVSFPTAAPSFVLTSATNGSARLLQTLQGLAEVNRSGQIVSYAPFLGSGARWNGSSSAGPTFSSIALHGTAAARVASGAWDSSDDASEEGNGSLGTVNVSLVFTLNDSSGPSPTTVGYTLNVSGWPWLHANDSLGVEVVTNASGPAGSWQASGASAIVERSTDSGATLATFAWGTFATARYPDGQQNTSSVGAYHNASTGGQGSLVRLDFGSVSGGYRSLEYDPWLTLAVPGPLSSIVPAWILSTDGIVAIATGSAVSVALAAVAVYRRRPPGEDL